MKKATGFFAYGSEFSHVGEFIENAITKINQKNSEIDLSSWKKLKVNGVFIISEILRKINEADFVCADITGMNNNVLFEIGFAIAKKKPIWLIHDTSVIGSVQKFKELNFLCSIGYKSFTNSDDIVESFENDYDDFIKRDLFSSLFSFLEPQKQERIILYLKSQISTDYNKYIINLFNTLGFDHIIDDPSESKVQPLTWYLERIISVASVLIEFSANNRSGHELQNSKCAFVAGIAIGLGLKTLIVAAEPYETPLDYKEYMRKFWNLETLQKAVDPFIYSVRDDLPKLLSANRKLFSTTKSISKLQKVQFGEFIAEHESDHIYDYYIETVHQQNLLKNEYNIVVGRKGTGKTATLYYLNDKYSRNVRNHICMIKPVNFELDGLMSIFAGLKDEFEKGYITESIWKFLIYTEIAKTIYENVKDKPSYALEESEGRLIKFVESHKRIFLSDFSTRLEEQLIVLKNLKSNELNGDFKKKLAEVFHQEIIGKVKDLVVDALLRKERLIVLIDNLDKSWRKDSNIDLTSKFLLGLLGVVGRVAKDFRNATRGLQRKFQFNLTLFLRSDIFKYVQQSAREPDKLEVTKLLWADQEIFMRMINERINTLNSNDNLDSEFFWGNLIAEVVDGISVKRYIYTNIIPRPRDIIFFFTAAKNLATARGHYKIESSDLVDAQAEYSNWVFKSIIVENGITMSQMEEFLFNLMGENQILHYDEITKLIHDSKLPATPEFSNYFIDRLVSLTLLGREVREGTFEFVYDFEADDKNKVLAKKLGSKRFKIHNAFASFLECNTVID